MRRLKRAQGNPQPPAEETISEHADDTHSTTMGYLLWIFGFLGAHRFYYGRPVTGTLWFLTLGLLFVGWVIDLFLIPSMDRQADRRFVSGPKGYNLRQSTRIAGPDRRA